MEQAQSIPCASQQNNLTVRACFFLKELNRYHPFLCFRNNLISLKENHKRKAVMVLTTTALLENAERQRHNGGRLRGILATNSERGDRSQRAKTICGGISQSSNPITMIENFGSIMFQFFYNKVRDGDARSYSPATGRFLPAVFQFSLN